MLEQTWDNSRLPPPRPAPPAPPGPRVQLSVVGGTTPSCLFAAASGEENVVAVEPCGAAGNPLAVWVETGLGSKQPVRVKLQMRNAEPEEMITATPRHAP